MPAKRTFQEYVDLVHAKWGDRVTPLGYIDSKAKAPIRCNSCGGEMEISPNRLLRQAIHLTCCESNHQLPSTESYIQELISVDSPMRPTEQYKGRWKKIEHKCLVCGGLRKQFPKHLIRGTGCYYCAKENNGNRFGFKTVQSHGKIRKLQGYEPQALELMLSYGANPDKLFSDVADGKPTVPYRFAGKCKTYIPDFFYSPKNRIVEVKSTWTLGLKDSNMFKKNVAKAKACVELGYDFTLFLFTKKNKRIVLPKKWYNMNQVELRTFVFAKVQD